MPILHSQLLAQGVTPDGKQIILPPAVALRQQGPVVQVSVSLPEAVAKGLLAQAKTVPPPKTGFALIDTGASGTCVDAEAAKEMQLPVIDVGSMISASHTKTPCNIHPLMVELVGFPIRFNLTRCAGAALKEQGLLMLLGRDLLAGCTFFYNGLTGQITLAI